MPFHNIVDPATRSRMMSGIKGKNTSPEMTIRRGLHARGFRYRLHDKRLPGKPDIVLPKHNAIIEIQGCFWHCHDCHLFKWPSTRKRFWRDKIKGNIERDRKNAKALQEAGWRLLIVWECALKGKQKRPTEEVLSAVAEWICGDPTIEEIEGIGNSR